MSTSIQNLRAVYQVKPQPRSRPTRKGTGSGNRSGIKQSVSMHNIQLRSVHQKRDKPLKRSPVRARSKNSKQHPTRKVTLRHQSSSFLDTSIDNEISKLESITAKNLNIRKEWLNVQQRMIEIGIRKKLTSIKESRESSRQEEYYPETVFENPIDVLIQKYESKAFLTASK